MSRMTKRPAGKNLFEQGRGVMGSLQREHMPARHTQRLAVGHARNGPGMMAHDHTTVAATHHGQGHLQLEGLPRAGVRHAAVDIDLGGRVKAQAQALIDRLQTVLQIGFEAIWVKAAKQRFA